MSNINLNYQIIVKILAFITLLTGLFMLPAVFCAYYYREWHMLQALGFSAAVTMLFGGTILYFLQPVKPKAHLRAREGYLVVSLCWVIASLFGALPYFVSGFAPDFIDSFFESVAGFTTTGCTALHNAIMPKSLLLWKAISHWLGGMGILIFVVSILPTLGVNGQLIAQAESPGPVLQKMAVKMSDSAKILYLMYLSFTIIETVLLCLDPSMTTFDALINTLGSISTGGLFAHPNGIGYYDSLYVELVISVFTILSSVNFILYFYLLKRQWRNILEDVELRSFLCILTVAVAACTAVLCFVGNYPSFGKALRDSFFQVVSVITTSGYSSVDYTVWPTTCKIILFTLMFVGGCAASTCGSIKVVRILILFKLIFRGFYKRIHPRAVIAIKFGDRSVSAPMVSSITAFIFIYMAVFFLSAIILSLQGLDLETTISTSASLLSNTGIAFGEVGATSNYSIFSNPLKLYLCLIMIMGRLELFTIIILFTRSFWGKDR